MTLAPAETLALESLLAFWVEAGVDACLYDEPVDKLRRPSPALAPPPPEPVAAAPVAAVSAPGTPDLEAAVAAARALAEGAADLPTLIAALEGFDGAGQRPTSARRVLFARGPSSPGVVVVGGPPAADEEAAGEAFAGAAGRLLDRMLAAAGLADSALRLHAVPWRPPGDRPPTDAEAAVALPFVRRAIELARPAAVLVLGDWPAKVLLGRAEGVLKLRGRPVDNLSQAGRVDLPTSLVTFSPAFLLKQPRLKAQAWSDLLALARTVAALRNDP